MDWEKHLRLLNVTSISLRVCILLSCGNSNKSQQYNSVEDEEEYYDNEGNGIEDGTYSADVDYYNPDTGYSATYTLDVEVQDGCVTTIYFPDDGYLDAKTSKIESAITSLEAQRDDLNALKQSIISEAVTGKIDVRDWKPNK